MHLLMRSLLLYSYRSQCFVEHLSLDALSFVSAQKRFGVIRLRTAFSSSVLLLSLALPLCAIDAPQGWRLEKLETFSGFARPESVIFHPTEASLIVSNQNGPFWKKDGKGYLSCLPLSGAVAPIRWLSAEEENVFHKPAGMAWCRGSLWVADIDCIRICDPRTRQIRTIHPPGAQWLNDIATDGARIFVSDSKSDVIFAVHPDESITRVIAPPGPNGLALFRGKLYGVSYKTHEIYLLDAEGRDPPKAFGLAKHFKFLDGLAILPDGTLLVTDYSTGHISSVSPDGRTVNCLAVIEQPADLMVDAVHNRVYVPQISPGQLQVFRLVPPHSSVP